MMPETPLSQNPIRCAACDQVVANFDAWYTEDCSAAGNRHLLDWPRIMLLKFKMEVKT